MTGAGEELPPLDWNARWQGAAAGRWRRSEEHAGYWNRRAPSFGARCPDGAYTRALLDLVAPEPEWSVLDVGCGAGTLAVPLARRVRQVTAMDFSEGMLAQLRHRLERAALDNVRPLLGAWEDDWDQLRVGTHDLALASRSLVVEDLAGALAKLDRAASRAVFITSIVGDGPRDRRALEAVGRRFRPGPDYIYVVNLLHQMGIYANVTLIDAEREWQFQSPGEALAFYESYLADLTPDERVCLQAYLARELVEVDGRWTLRRPDRIRWAVIGWRKG